MLQTETRFCQIIHNPVTSAGMNPHHIHKLITEVCIPWICRHGWANRHERHRGTTRFSNSAHNIDVRHKSSSDRLYMDDFQANSKSQLEPTGDGLLMSMTGQNDNARLNYGGPSRPRLAVLNTLKPPTSVRNCTTATYDMLCLGSDPFPVDDTEPGVLHLHVLLCSSSQFVELCILLCNILYLIQNNNFTASCPFLPPNDLSGWTVFLQSLYLSFLK